MFGFCGSLCGVFLYIVACLRGGRRKGRGGGGGRICCGHGVFLQGCHVCSRSCHGFMFFFFFFCIVFFKHGFAAVVRTRADPKPQKEHKRYKRYTPHEAVTVYTIPTLLCGFVPFWDRRAGHKVFRLYGFMQLHAVFHCFFRFVMVSYAFSLFYSFFCNVLFTIYTGLIRFFLHGFMRSFTVLWLRAGLGSFWGFQGSRLEGF